MADYVSKYTGSEVDGILDDAIELPQATSNDNGKFLKINDQGELIWQDIPDWVFTEGESGQYLRMTGSTAHPGWDNADDPLPSRTLANDGDVLKYNNDGLEWSPLIDTSNAGANEFLKYNGTGNLVWDKPVPDFDSSNLYTALMVVNSSGHPALQWSDPFDTSGANDGDFLKYSSNSGIMWDEVPGIDMTDADDGEFLRYNNGSLSWENPLNTSNANNGDFLKYSSDTGIMWDTVLPDSGSDGEVLIYGDNGPEWDSLPLSSIPCGSCYDILITNGANEIEWASASDIEFLPTAPSSGLILVSSSNGPTWVHPSEILQ